MDGGLSAFVAAKTQVTYNWPLLQRGLPMLLTIDIGNTTVTIGVFDGERLTTTLRIATDSRQLADEYGLVLTNLLRIKGVDPSVVDEACICSVVPPLTVVFDQVCRSYFSVKPLVVTVGTRTGLKILYDSPQGRWVRPHRRRRGGHRAVRPPVDSSGHRHRHRVRRRDQGGSLSGRGHRARNQPGCRSPVPKHVAAAAGGVDRPQDGHRTEHHGGDAIGPGARLHRAGDLHGGPVQGRVGGRRQGHRHRGPGGPHCLPDRGL